MLELFHRSFLLTSWGCKSIIFLLYRWEFIIILLYLFVSETWIRTYLQGIIIILLKHWLVHRFLHAEVALVLLHLIRRLHMANDFPDRFVWALCLDSSRVEICAAHEVGAGLTCRHWRLYINTCCSVVVNLLILLSIISILLLFLVHSLVVLCLLIVSPQLWILLHLDRLLISKLIMYVIQAFWENIHYGVCLSLILIL